MKERKKKEKFQGKQKIAIANIYSCLCIDYNEMGFTAMCTCVTKYSYFFFFTFLFVSRYIFEKELK
jgi:hypothetical protein